MKAELFAYLGINDEGKVGMYVSPFRLNPLGGRHEKGRKLPESVTEFPGWDELEALQDLQEYFDALVADKKSYRPRPKQQIIKKTLDAPGLF